MRITTLILIEAVIQGFHSIAAGFFHLLEHASLDWLALQFFRQSLTAQSDIVASRSTTPFSQLTRLCVQKLARHRFCAS
jgi:hypothetical protein